MVSVNRTPAQGFYFFDPMNSMEFHHASNANSLPPSTTAAAAPKSSAASGAGGVPCAEDHSKKVRKPYTITKSRENWTEQEHDKFLEALHLFDRDWKKIEAFVGSKTVIQIRSHAQKYFLKVQKSGTSEHVPPPRPKRKAAHPYPQKAPKNALVVSLVNVPFQTSSALYEPGYIVRPDGSALLCNPHASAALPSWSHDTPSAMSGSQVTQDDVQTSAPVVPTYSSSNDSTPRSLRNSQAIVQGDQQKRLRVMPDFARVYRFIGSVFDPNSSGHMQRLKQMDPIDLETALLLMRNLCVNLMSPEFEVHRRLLASYDGDPKVKTRGSSDLCSDRSESITLSA